jgi:hypothetical protein
MLTGSLLRRLVPLAVMALLVLHPDARAFVSDLGQWAGQRAGGQVADDFQR